MHTPKWQLFTDAKGEWRFRFVAGNGEIVAQSEGYKRRASAEEAIQLITDTIRATVGVGTFSVIKQEVVEA